MARQISQIRFLAKVRLTPVNPESPNGVDVAVSDLIAYSQQSSFTRLRLTGKRTLDVKETTERIDALIRNSVAAS